VFESKIRPVADVEAVQWLVATNQFLSHKLSEATVPQLPAVIAMRAGVHGVEILLDEECPPVDGFVSAGDRAWRLDGELELAHIESVSAYAHPYCPALLPVGETDVGDLLLDLEQLDTVSVSGDDDTMLGWMRSVAIGVTSTPWSQECEVVAIGVDDALAGIAQVTVPADPQAWAQRTATVMAATAKRLPVSPYASRVNPGEIHYPTIVLVGPGYEGVAQYLGEVSCLAHAPITVVAAAPIADAYRLELSPDSGSLEPTGLDFSPTVTAADAVRLTTELIAAASQSITVPTDQLLDEPSPSTTEPHPESAEPTETEPAESGLVVDSQGVAPEQHVEWPALQDEPPPDDEYYGEPMDYQDHEAPVDIDLTAASPMAEAIPAAAAASLEEGDGDDDEPPAGPGGDGRKQDAVAPQESDSSAAAESIDVSGSAAEYATVSGAAAPSKETVAKILAIVAPKPIEVRVLCPKPEVTGLTEQPSAKIEAVVTYLVFHRSVLSEKVRNEFWPSSLNRSTSDNAIAKIRQRLGTAPDGASRLSFSRNTGRYEVSDEAGCDWERFNQLVLLAACVSSSADQMAILEAALQLVTGAPTVDAPRKYYGWLRDDHAIYSELARKITDAAHKLGDLALADDVADIELAQWAAEKGLLGQPDHEAMRRIQMRAASLAGDGKGVEDAYRRATEVAESHSAFEELQPETEELYATLTRRQSISGTAEQAQN